MVITEAHHLKLFQLQPKKYRGIPVYQYFCTPLLIKYQMGSIKQKNAFEHAQNAQI